MLCLVNITDNKLADWMFGQDVAQLIRKAEHQLFVEQSTEKQRELRELVVKLSRMVYTEPGKVRLTSHYYLINEWID